MQSSPPGAAAPTPPTSGLVITDPRVIATILEHIDIRAACAPPIASS